MNTLFVGAHAQNKNSMLSDLLSKSLPNHVKMKSVVDEDCDCVFFEFAKAEEPSSALKEKYKNSYKVLCFIDSEPDIKLLNFMDWDSIYVKDKSSTTITDTLESALEKISKKNILRLESTGAKDQIQNLSKAKEQMEQALLEHLREIEGSKKEMQVNLNEARAHTVYLKKLAHCEELEEILKLLRDELKSFQNISNISLVLSLNEHADTIVSFQGSSCISKKTKANLNKGNSIRFNDESDRNNLAKCLERPIGKVLLIPIQRKERWRKSNNKTVNDYLVIEHSVADKEANQLVAIVQKRLEPFASSVDRALLLQQVHTASQIWERIFDHLSDGLAIVDESGDILRSNSSFKSKLGDWDQLSEVMGDNRKEISWKSRKFEIRRFPIQFESTGPAIAHVVFFRDLTDDEEIRTALLQNEKMAAIGSLAGRIAHELNNPLTGIVSMCQILIAEKTLSDQPLSDVSEIELAAKRCQDIIKNLLDFTESEKDFELEDVDINDVVAKTIPLLKTALRDLTLNLDLYKNELIVRGNFRLMQQVLFNLLINACQASESGSEIHVRTELLKHEGFEVIYLKVRDNGVGIAKDLLDRVFEHFFTTKEKGKGTGLGLSVSKSIVESFGGSIRVQSDLGRGSEFIVQFPVGSKK